MKKTTIYTLLCTAILVPGIALGMDGKEELVPKTPTKGIREELDKISKTPDVSKIIQQDYPSNIFSPDTGKFLAERDRSKISSENALRREKLEQQLKTLDFQKRMEKLEKEEEEKRLALLKMAQQELSESENKSRELDAEMKNADQRAQLAEEGLKELNKQLESMREEAEREKIAIKKGAESDSQVIQSQLEETQSQLEEARTKAAREREQKLMVRKSAEEDLKNKNARIKEVEELVEKRVEEINSLRLDYRKLQLEKERMAEAHAIKTGFKTSEVGIPSPKKLAEIIPQPQDQVPTAGNEVNNLTIPKEKRVAKNKTDTKF
jgi:DNA repair exonuclease SbcCD ATPase subunit